MSKYASVPPSFKKLFETADEFVSNYFKQKLENPQEGSIEIDSERYILIRASSMSVELFKTINRLYEEENQKESFNVVKNLLFDIAHAIGKSDAAFFHKKCDLKDPIAKLSAGPIHFAFTGWASVNILPESNATPDDSYCLIYEHPYSFESDSWIQSKMKCDSPVCIMNAGYSSGWCEQSFGIDLVASEITCRAAGDDKCSFIMAPPHRIQDRINELVSSKKASVKESSKYTIPGFFKRKEIEQRLRKSELQYQILFENANDAIFILKNEKISQVNSVAAKILKIQKQDIINHSILHFSPRIQVNNQASEAIWKEKFSLALSGEPSIFEWQFTQPDGSLVDTEISLKLVDTEKPIFHAICRDITQRRKLEKYLIQSQKMEAIGTLASGIAHDFNSILSGMLGFTSLLKISLSKSDTNIHYLERIEKAVQKAADLTKQLLTFSKTGQPRSVPLNINEHINNTLNIIDRTFNKNITIDVRLDKHLKPIEGDPSQIEQMILNLCLNASKAMPDGGTLTIKTSMLPRDKLEKDLNKEQLNEFKHSEVVGIEIADEGIGMSAETINRIFEPYYSLRQNGSGSGLGMLIVYNIINSHNGQIIIKSVPGEGTRVKLFLHPTDKPIQMTTHKEYNLQSGDETILVADDENIIVDFLEELLKPLGYTILTAKDGLEAINKFQTYSGKIDLAILNTGMPKLSGKEVFYQLINEFPACRIILTSGLPFTKETRKKLLELGVKGFVSKPFKAEVICHLIRAVLDNNK